MTVWGVMLGTMISMFDFINHLPYSESFLGGEKSRNLLLHIFTATIGYILCLIRDTKYSSNDVIYFQKALFRILVRHLHPCSLLSCCHYVSTGPSINP